MTTRKPPSVCWILAAVSVCSAPGLLAAAAGAPALADPVPGEEEPARLAIPSDYSALYPSWLRVAPPHDYVTLFPSWQRGYIVDGRLIHAAGEDGILLALFSTDLHGAAGDEVRTLLPFTHMDPAMEPEKRNAFERHWGPVHPTLPPMLHQWDVLDGQLMILYGGIKTDEEIRRKHHFRARTYTLASIGGHVQEVPGPTSRRGFRLGSLGQDDSRRTMPVFDEKDHDRLMHFSFRRVEAEGEFEILTHPLLFQHKRLMQSVPWQPSDEEPVERVVSFLPDYRREAFIHFVVAGQYFLIRDTGPLGRLTAAHLSPRSVSFYAEWLRYTDEGSFRMDRASGEWVPVPGDPLDPVADFSGIPDWVASDPSSHFMVQDRDLDMVRFFWGGFGYAELEVMGVEPAAADAGDGEETVRVRFEQVPAPPEMEHVRSLLLNPPEFDRPEVYYKPFEGDRALP